MRISGVGPDVPRVVNENGGAQSATPYRFDLLDPIVMFRLAKVIGLGAEKYGDDNWSRISAEDHLNHAVQHIYAWLAGDAQEDHLGHALCRVVYAAAVEQAGDEAASPRHTRTGCLTDQEIEQEPFRVTE